MQSISNQSPLSVSSAMTHHHTARRVQRRGQHCADTRGQLQLVQALVLSQMDCCSVIWSNTAESNLHKLQVTSNKAARMILRCPYKTRVSEMNDQLAWLSVKSRLHCSLVCFIKNIITTKKPVILYNKLSFVLDRHSYSTRESSESCILLPPCRIRAKQRTVCDRAMVAWNSLPRFLISGSSTASFKKRLKLYLFTQEVA